MHGREQRLPEISLATVYNTLNELVAMGEILEIAAAGTAKRYDPNARLAHQHLVCTSCGELWDVFPSGEGALALVERDRHGFEVSGVEIVFRGRCPSCVAAGAPGQPAAVDAAT